MPSPIRSYDKKLLKNHIPKREFSITQEEEIFYLPMQKQNKQMFHIAKLSLMAAVRRSKLVTLTRSQIKENYIQLAFTKSGKPRKAYTVAAED